MLSRGSLVQLLELIGIAGLAAAGYYIGHVGALAFHGWLK